MEAAIQNVVGVYLKSSKGKENLGEKEFQSLVKTQLKNILTDSEDNQAVKIMRQQLDNNKDGKVGFPEYMSLIGYLAQALSDQRCLEKETEGESSTQETQTEAAASAQAEPKAEPQVAKEAEKEVKPVVEKAAAEAQKPEEEKKADVKQEGVKVEEKKAEENKAEEKIKTEEAS